jgi:amino acid transporter
VTLREALFGRPLRSDEDETERIGVLTGVPVLGLDALASAAYGPEAALTVLLPLGAIAAGHVGGLTLAIGAILVVVALSYGQTIRAYPNGGGSFTVAKENLGRLPGLLAAAALCTDYVLNVAVAISAGVAAAASAVPALLPHTLVLCLGVLLLLAIVNLRGVRDSGLVFLAPTYAFLACLFGAIALGVIRTLSAHGHPTAVVAPPAPAAAVEALAPWLLLRAFASGCTALTGIEAVSNATPIFSKPKVRHARRTLATIAACLLVLIAGEAFLSRAYGITATVPGQSGYQSVLSQMVGAVSGRGAFYYVTMSAIFAVLALSANTSFADFPRVCRLLALDEYLPGGFAHRGRRLVYSNGIVLLAILSALILVAFGGITDRLIPLFAVGAFLSFTLSQAGMVVHWRRQRGGHATRSLVMNAIGALATFVTLCIIAASKFTEGAWLTLVIIPALVVLFLRVRAVHERIARERTDPMPLEVTNLVPPIMVVPLHRLDRVAHKALRLAMTLSPEVRAVQVLTEDMKLDDLTGCWQALVEEPARKAGLPAPRLVVLPSVYREFFGPFLAYLRKLSASEPERPITVLVPELVRRKWYHFFVQSRATLLKALLLLEGGPQISVLNTPWYLADEIDERALSRPPRRSWKRVRPLGPARV